ncbi:hypothetical protein U1Q18_037236 [Sarracenia purpurea var. burkii]
MMKPVTKLSVDMPEVASGGGSELTVCEILDLDSSVPGGGSHRYSYHFFRKPTDLAGLVVSLCSERCWWKHHGQVALLRWFEPPNLAALLG